MKAYVGINEKYPVFELEPQSVDNNEIEVAPTTLARWQKVSVEYAAMQKELKVLVDPQPLDPSDPKNTTIDGTKL